MAKSPLFQSMQRALRLSALADQHGLDADEALGLAQAQAAPSITRRAFLQKAGMGMAGIAALSLLPSMRWPGDDDTRIVIVGAGMAGLHAAHVLKKGGISKNVMVYEASNRVGGRMMTKKLNGNSGTTELGGEFVDSNHLDIRALAKEFGVTELYKSSDLLEPEMFRMDGKAYRQRDFVAAFQRIRKQVGRDARSRGSKRLALDRMGLDAYFSKLPADAWFKKLLEVAFIGEMGLELAEQSALNFVDLVGKQRQGTFEIFGESDESIKLLGGNQQLCDRIAERIEGQIVLDAPLVAIRHQGGKFELTFQTMKAPVIADLVVMTIPYTVLRTVDGIDQLPGMTAAKLRCIRELGTGQNGKYFLDMQHRVWRDQSHQGYLYTPRIHTSWDSYHLQNENVGKSIYSVFFGGKSGAEIAKGGAEAYLDEITAAFPGFKDQYSGFNAQMNWWQHPWAKGSYICPRPGQYADIGPEIAKPVGNMIFAGEHTSVEFGGFMNGAAETGRLAAQEIIRRLSAR